MKSPQRAILAFAMLLIGASGSNAEPLRAALFPFELDDTSLGGEMHGPSALEAARISNLSTQLAEALSASAVYRQIPLGAAVAAEAQATNIRTCDGCEVDLARKIDAQVSFFGWVQKVSELIININLVVRDVATGKVVHAGSVDIRGNTDESWTRGLKYLLDNRILVQDGSPK